MLLGAYRDDYNGPFFQSLLAWGSLSAVDKNVG